VDSDKQTARTNGSNELRAVLYVGSLLSLRLLLSIDVLYVYTHKPFIRAVRLFVIAVDVGSADSQTFLAQSPYVFYEGEKCKVVGTIHIV
jgi:hypothetical protein